MHYEYVCARQTCKSLRMVRRQPQTVPRNIKWKDFSERELGMFT